MNLRITFLVCCVFFLEMGDAQNSTQNADLNIQDSGVPAIFWTTKSSGVNKTHTVDFLMGEPSMYLQPGVDPTQLSLPLLENLHVTQLGFDYNRYRGYWTETGGIADGGRSIGYFNMNESLSKFAPESVIPNFYGISAQIGGIAVDWLDNNIYWTDGAYNWIAVTPVTETAKFDYSTGNDLMAVVVDQELDEPGGIVVHPHKGLMFWTNVYGLEGKVERSTLSGKGRMVLAAGLSKPWDITIDYATDTLYWADFSTGIIESISIDGSNRQQVYADPMAKLYGVVNYKDMLIATDQNENALIIMKKDQSSVRKIPVDGTPYDIEVYASNIQQPGNSTCDTYGCSNICVSEPGNMIECLCTFGELLDDDGKSCIVNSSLSRTKQPQFYYSTSSSIMNYPFNFPERHPQQIEFHEGKEDFHAGSFRRYVALAFDTYAQTLFFADEGYRQIYSWKLSETGKVPAVPVNKPGGLAVDWYTSRIYWTDKLHGQLWCSTYDGYKQVLLLKDLQEPMALLVDPLEKSMYWVENSLNSVIYKADLDGRNKRIIVDSRNGTIRGIHLNYADDRFYWINSGLRIIMSSKKDGSDQQVIHTNGGTGMQGITSYKDYIIWTDTNGIHSAHKSDYSREADETDHDASAATDIITYDRSQQPQVPGISPCDVDNGGCEDMCIPTPSGRSCACRVGLLLQSDGTCTSATLLDDDFLLVADTSRREMFQFNLNGTLIGSIKVNEAHITPRSASYDYLRKQIYWIDSSSSHNLIKRINVDGTGETVIVQPTWNAYFDRMALEPASGNLFYTDYFEEVINVVTMASPHYRRTIIKYLSSPRDIEVDPVEGRVYWTDYGIPETISSAYMDGTNIVDIIQLGLYYPFGLALDLVGRKVYWADGVYEEIERANLDGSDRESVYQRSNSYFYGLDFSSGYIYVTDVFKNTLDRIDKEGQKSVDLTEPILGRGRDVHVYRSTDVRANTTCSVDNGLCSHICLPKLNSHVCECPNGMELKDDGINCNGVQTCDKPAVRNGGLDPKCTFRDGSTCDVICDAGYRSTQAQIAVSCTNGTWDYSNWDYSCEIIPTQCSVPVIRNGVVSPQCSRRVGEKCDVACDLNYQANVTEIMCNRDAAWEGQLDNLCNLIKCPANTFKNGKFKDGCETTSGSSCDIVCDGGYKAHPSASMCLRSGQWDVELETVCKDIEPPTMTCPSDMTLVAKPGQTTVNVRLPMPTDAQDNSGGPVTFSYDHGAISQAMVEGDHDILISARDTAGNIKTCRFKVTIKVLRCSPIQLFVVSEQLTSISCPTFLGAQCFAECKEGYQMKGSLYYRCELDTPKTEEIDGSEKAVFKKSSGECKEIPTTTTPVATTPAGGVEGKALGQGSSVSDENIALIVGLSVAGVVALALIVCIAFLILKRWRRNSGPGVDGSTVRYNIQTDAVAMPAEGLGNPLYDEINDKKEPIGFNEEVTAPDNGFNFHINETQTQF